MRILGMRGLCWVGYVASPYFSLLPSNFIGSGVSCRRNTLTLLRRTRQFRHSQFHLRAATA
jgi:hypothetical protein